jgi:hypothetical protein
MDRLPGLMTEVLARKIDVLVLGNSSSDRFTEPPEVVGDTLARPTKA